MRIPACFAAIALAVGAAAFAPALAHDYSIGEIAIGHPWTRATPPGAPTAAGYLTLRNAGSTADRLAGGSSPAAARLEIHMMEVKDGVMTMRPVEGGLEVPAGGSVELKPGGLHLMFISPSAPFKEGERVTATLEFEKAGKVEVEFVVAPIGSPAPAHGSAPGHSGH